MRKAANRIPISNSVGGAIFPAWSTACVLGRRVLYVGEEVFSPETGNSPEGGGKAPALRKKSNKQMVWKGGGRREQREGGRANPFSKSPSPFVFFFCQSVQWGLLLLLLHPFCPFCDRKLRRRRRRPSVAPLSSFGTRGQKRRQNERNIRFV